MAEKLPLVKIKQILCEGIEAEKERRKIKIGDETSSAFSTIYEVFDGNLDKVEESSEDFLREIFNAVIESEQNRQKIFNTYGTKKGDQSLNYIVHLEKINNEKLKIIKKNSKD